MDGSVRPEFQVLGLGSVRVPLRKLLGPRLGPNLRFSG